MKSGPERSTGCLKSLADQFRRKVRTLSGNYQSDGPPARGVGALRNWLWRQFASGQGCGWSSLGLAW